MSKLIREATINFSSGNDLDAAMTESLLDEMIATEDETLLSEIFLAWDRKGIATTEI